MEELDTNMFLGEKTGTRCYHLIDRTPKVDELWEASVESPLVK